MVSHAKHIKCKTKKLIILGIGCHIHSRIVVFAAIQFSLAISGGYVAGLFVNVSSKTDNSKPMFTI